MEESGREDGAVGAREEEFALGPALALIAGVLFAVLSVYKATSKRAATRKKRDVVSGVELRRINTDQGGDEERGGEDDEEEVPLILT